ncbi:MAG: methionine aminotransferase [Desulfobacterales bacterium]|nr:methionine aminotransferase [Desulfobacterales bacterium]
MNIQSKLPDVGTTIFTVMTGLANEHDAINLSQGFPEFNPHPDLISLVEKYMREGYNQYAPLKGVPVLREKIVQKTEELYGHAYDANKEITLTSGATEALYTVITTVVNPGDEVIIFEPAFDSYMPVVKLCGGKKICLQLKHPDYRIDWDEVKSAITPKTRLMIINSPHNPTGAVLTQQDMASLIDVVKDTDVMILSDEVYEHIIFNGTRHESIARYPELVERSFIVSSFGKTYHTTGWKTGYCLAPAPLSKELDRVHQYITFTPNSPIQYAYAEFMEKKEMYLELGAFYQKKREIFLSLIEDSRFKVLPAHGTFFQMLDYSDISDEPDTEFAKRLTIEHGVAAIPPSVFYSNSEDYKVLRFCFAKKDNTLEKAAERLCRI